MARRKLSVSLHVGVHKTATTHLQQTLAANTDQLNEAGLRALLPRQLRGPGQKISDLFGLEQDDQSHRPGVRRLARLLPDPMNRLVISEENFIGMWRGPDRRVGLPLYPNAEQHIAALAQSIAPHVLDVFVALRDPCRFLWSCYSQNLMAGDVMDPFAFFMDRGPQHIDWVDLVRRIRAVPGVRKVGVWPYEAYPMNSTAIYRHMLRWRMGRLVHPEPARLNPGLSEMAMRKTMEWQAEGREGNLAHDARDAYPVGDDWPPYDPFPPEMRAEIRESYIAQLEEIAAMDGIMFLGPGGMAMAELVGPWDRTNRDVNDH